MKLFTIESVSSPGTFIVQPPRSFERVNPAISRIIFYTSPEAAQRVIDTQPPEVAANMRVVSFVFEGPVL